MLPPARLLGTGLYRGSRPEGTAATGDWSCVRYGLGCLLSRRNSLRSKLERRIDRGFRVGHARHDRLRCLHQRNPMAGREEETMPRILISYLLWWVRLYYRIGHAVAHWFLRIVPMPSRLRHRLAGTVSITPYLFMVWAVVGANHFTWTAIGVGVLITALLLVLVHTAEARRAFIGR